MTIFFYQAGAFGGTQPGHFFAINVAAVSPMSRELRVVLLQVNSTPNRAGGSIKLNTSDPLDPPLIDPGLLRSRFDVLTLREGIKMAQKFVTAPVWKGYIIEQTTPDLENMTTDSALEQYIRNTGSTSSHLVGSAGMSARNAGHGVVNPDLLLKGAAGLRVIDASVLVSQ